MPSGYPNLGEKKKREIKKENKVELKVKTIIRKLSSDSIMASKHTEKTKQKRMPKIYKHSHKTNICTESSNSTILKAGRVKKNIFTKWVISKLGTSKSKWERQKRGKDYAYTNKE